MTERRDTDRDEYTWRQPDEVRQADARYVALQERERRLNLKAFLMSVAVILAPFFALVFGLDAALFVLVLAMAFTTWVTWDGANRVGPVLRSRLRVAAVLNGLLALLVLGLLLLRLLA